MLCPHQCQKQTYALAIMFISLYSSNTDEWEKKSGMTLILKWVDKAHCSDKEPHSSLARGQEAFFVGVLPPVKACDFLFRCMLSLNSEIHAKFMASIHVNTVCYA